MERRCSAGRSTRSGSWDERGCARHSILTPPIWTFFFQLDTVLSLTSSPAPPSVKAAPSRRSNLLLNSRRLIDRTAARPLQMFAAGALSNNHCYLQPVCANGCTNAAKTLEKHTQYDNMAGFFVFVLVVVFFFSSGQTPKHFRPIILLNMANYSHS